MKGSDDSSIVQVAGQTVTSRVVSHIQTASRNTGVSFSYLMAQAGKESSFQPEAGSRASSAAGLFQFTKSTWLSLVKTHGADHGLGDLAQHITRTRRGEYAVDDPAVRQKILDLRRDPQLSSLMAGEYAKDNKSLLEKTLGRKVDSTDLYLAHFLGPGGAAKVLRAKADDPSQPAAPLLPQAAQKNASVFYDTDHTPRSVAAVYDRIHHAIERPMKQYAQLEQRPAAADGHKQKAQGTAKTAAKTAAAGPDPVWPFETAQAPGNYGGLAGSAQTVAAAAAATDQTTQLAYTGGDRSADQISSAMPSSDGAQTQFEPKTPFGRLLKNLFG